jgi:hypothetical protein
MGLVPIKADTYLRDEGRVSDSRYRVACGWDAAPHLDEATKAKLLAGTPPHLRDARSKGIPSLGSGAIYPLMQEEFTCDPFAIPKHWWKAYGLDVGWNRTAAPFGAWDKDGDVIYLYSEHYRGQAEPSIHADAIKARGEWLTGAIDPAANGRSQKDGTALMDAYIELDLNLEPADNSVEAGILAVWQLLSTGRLVVFKTLRNWLSEHMLYRRDENGKIIKANDHLMDATRYLIMERHTVFRPPPVTLLPSDSDFAIADSRGGY